VIERYRPYSVNLNKDLFENMGLEKGLSLLRKIREEGTRVALWTLNDSDLFLKVRDVCDFLITDRSDVMMEVV
jgi:glycerophosphoryl diester phosphodiesterase